MKSTRNSDRLREILLSTRHQIVALKDIQIDLMRLDAKVANQVATQISALEEVYKHQLSLVTLAENVEPKRNGWFSGHIKTKEDRLANIMD
jgi:flagellar biosynthesis chaperone FliJ